MRHYVNKEIRGSVLMWGSVLSFRAVSSFVIKVGIAEQHTVFQLLSTRLHQE